MENGIQIKQNGQYKNLDLRDMNNGDTIVVTKNKYAEGKEFEGKYGKFFNVQVEYQGEECSMIINKVEEHGAFASCGGVGDKVKITMHKEIKKNKMGREYVARSLTFEQV